MKETPMPMMQSMLFCLRPFQNATPKGLTVRFRKIGVALQDLISVEYQSEGVDAHTGLNFRSTLPISAGMGSPSVANYPGVSEQQQRWTEFSHDLGPGSRPWVQGGGGDLGNGSARIHGGPAVTKRIPLAGWAKVAAGEQRGQPEHGAHPPWGGSKVHVATISAGRGPALIDKIFQTYRKTMPVKEPCHADAI